MQRGVSGLNKTNQLSLVAFGTPSKPNPNRSPYLFPFLLFSHSGDSDNTNVQINARKTRNMKRSRLTWNGAMASYTIGFRNLIGIHLQLLRSLFVQCNSYQRRWRFIADHGHLR